MKFFEQEIPGVYLIQVEPFTDERGLFRRHYCKRELTDHGIAMDVKQCNVSENPNKYTLRGLHFQRPPNQEGKILSCFKGAFYDVILDLRPKSSTYTKWISIELTEENRTSVYVPEGCANGYLTLRYNTWIFYYHSEYYTPASEGGILFDDPFFQFKWPHNPRIISEKDKNHPLFISE